MLKYNIWCNDGNVFSPKRYDTSDRFRRIGGSVQESRIAYWKTPNRQRFGEQSISTPSPPSQNTENQKKKRRVREKEISTDDSIIAEGGKDKRKAVTRSPNCKLREEAEIKEVLKKLEKLSKLVRTNAVGSFSGVEEISYKVSRKESFIDAIAREGTELKAVPKELEISRLKNVASKDDKVRRSQAKRRMVGKTPGTMEEKLLTPELNTPLKVVLEESDKIAEGADLRLRFEVEAGLLEEQCRANAREKMIAIVDVKFKKFARALSGVQLGLQDRSIELEKRISQLEGEKRKFEGNLTREKEAFQLELEKEREAAALKLKEVRAESIAEAERLVTASTTSQNNLVGKLY
ncbi:hypothetical protein GIB67_016423 [Kingdonia uniflora]|uniref:Uncharacterized protein n=1 Tax=Kingdonia uniflora TaxID=39325 RepID=A0A7J7MH30_9MAGN|nr:hypothetical protein GIB67_016423 [Kingdonia uniflora]